MKDVAHDEINALGEDHWYFVNKRDLLRRLLLRLGVTGKRGLDLGAGLGANMRLLAEVCETVEGVELSEKAVGIAKKRGVEGISVGDACVWGEDEMYDVVLASDLVEHVDGDVVVANMCRILKKGGYVIVSVPAFGYLWSYMDDVALHRKRYTREELVRLFEIEGFEVIFVNYWQIWAWVPGVLNAYLERKGLMEKKLHLGRVPGWMEQGLRVVGIFENWLTMRVGWPVGVGLVLVGRKGTSEA